MTIPARARLRPLAALALAAPFLGACAGPLNTENRVGYGADAYTPATLARSSMPATDDPDAAPTLDQIQAPVYVASGVVRAERARPSITGIDRSNWSPTVVTVPNDLSAHQPIYTENVRFPTTTLRSRGRYPTPASALDTPTTRGERAQQKEALVAPFAAAADVALFIPRAIAQARPMRPTRAGLDPYERQPQQATIVNPPARLDDSAFTYDTSGAQAYDQPLAPPSGSTGGMQPTPNITPAPRPAAPPGARPASGDRLRPARTGVLGPNGQPVRPDQQAQPAPEAKP